MPKRNLKKAKSPRRRLLYTISPANEGLVIAEAGRARMISRIHDAISGASTWEDFRRAMPREEYSKVIQAFDDDGEPRPRGSVEFEPTMLPGYCDGDYPPWLQAEMHTILPEEILEEFARGEATMLSGDYDHIDPKHLPLIKARLEQLGYVVEDGTHLSFF